MGNCCFQDDQSKYDRKEMGNKNQNPSYQSHVSNLTNNSNQKSPRMEFSNSFHMQAGKKQKIQTFYEYPNYQEIKQLLNLILTKTKSDYWYEYEEQLEEIQQQLMEEKLYLENNYEQNICKQSFLHQKKLFIEVKEMSTQTPNKKIRQMYNPFIEFKFRKNEPFSENENIIKSMINSNVLKSSITQIQNGVNFNTFNKYDLTKELTGIPVEILKQQVQKINSLPVLKNNALSQISEQEQETESDILNSVTSLQKKKSEKQNEQSDKNNQNLQKSKTIIKDFSTESNNLNKQQISYRKYYLDFVVKAYNSKKSNIQNAKVIADPITFNLSEFTNQQVVQEQVLLKNSSEETIGFLMLKIQFINNITEFYEFWKAELATRLEQISRILKHIQMDQNNRIIDQDELEQRKKDRSRDREQSLLQEDIQSLINKSIFKQPRHLRSQENSIRSQQMSHSDSVQSSYYETGFFME